MNSADDTAFPIQILTRVRSWLQAHGLSVAHVNKGRTALEFSGTVNQLEQTFHTPIHRFVIEGVEHMANTSHPQIPAALAQVVGAVASLNDFKPKPHLVMGPSAKWNASSKRFLPSLTIANSGTNYLFVGPGDAATMYDAPNTLNSILASGDTIYDGTGITIRVAGDTLLYDSGPDFYRQFFNLPSSASLTTVYDGDQSNLDQNADETEAILDTEVSGGLAPNANVIYYGAGDTVFQSGLFLAIYLKSRWRRTGR